MEIKHDEKGGAGRFTTGSGADTAELTYSPAGEPNALVFDHTFVPGHLRGRGVAEQLVDHAVDYARSKGMKVVPACSYVRTLFQRHPEKYADVASEESRPFGGI